MFLRTWNEKEDHGIDCSMTLFDSSPNEPQGQHIDDIVDNTRM